MSTLSLSSTDPRPSVVGKALVGLIRIYQAARAGHVSPCRYTPTCSHYAVEALEVHGPRRGLGLAVRRLLRCRPGGPSGFDPVPPLHAGAPAASPQPSTTPDSPTGAM